MSILLTPILASLTLLSEPGPAMSVPLVSRAAVRAAVAAELQEERGRQDAAPPAQRFSATPMTDRQRRLKAFEMLMREAEVPFCLHQDGLKYQPTHIGPIGVAGILALPFVPIAALRGKCKM